MSTSNGQWYELCDCDIGANSSDDSDSDSMIADDIPAPAPTPTPTPPSEELADAFLLSPPPPPPPFMPPLTSPFQRMFEPLALLPPPLSPLLLPPSPPPPAQPDAELDAMWAALYGDPGSPIPAPILGHELHVPVADDSPWPGEWEAGGAHQTLAEDEVARAFPLVCVTDANERDGPSQCPICLEDFKAGDVVSQLPCNHAHCHQCIAKWLQVSPTCPVCRLDLAEESKKMSFYENLPYYYPELGPGASADAPYNPEEAGDARDGERDGTGGSQGDGGVGGASQSGAASG